MFFFNRRIYYLLVSKMNKSNDKLAPVVSTNAEVKAFLNQVAKIPKTGNGSRGRLLFAIDATLSRESTWDLASQIQSEMFIATKDLGGLEVQLAFYRGFGEMKVTKWLSAPDELVKKMNLVRCVAGRTQIRKVLRHTLKETKQQKVNALVFVGDVIEEDIDELGHLSGQLGLIGTPVFIFQDGEEPISKRGFQDIARLSNGAYSTFNADSAAQLSELLRAVAVFSAGGVSALTSYGKKIGGRALQISNQMTKQK